MDHSQNKQTYKSIYWPFALVAALMGIILSWGVLSGDEYGRVNLLYMLMLYFFVPVLMIIITLLGFISSHSHNSAKILIQSGLFKLRKLEYFRYLQKQHLSHIWLVQQSQVIALAFALSSILVFLFLLLFTDMTFIWRSTILTPEHLHPVLEVVSLPWSFIAVAQPDLELLRASQHFRLEQTAVNGVTPSQWWPFVLAVQVTYSLLPRLLMFTILGMRIKRSASAIDPVVSNEDVVSRQTTKPAGHILPLESLNGIFPILRWDAIPDTILNQLRKSYSQLGLEVCDVWQGTQEQSNALADSDMPIILVKAWEPPMGELSDQLQNNNGYILPLMWRDNNLGTINDINRDEWLRFAESNHWQLLELGDTTDV